MTEYATYKVWDGCKAPSNLEYNGRLVGQIVPGDEIVDIDALLALADRFEQEAKDASNAERRERHYNYELAAQCAGEACAYSNAARRIREALGVSDD